MKMREKFEEALKEMIPLGKEILDWMNAQPEASGHEKQTCAYLVKKLSEHGYKVTSPVKRIKYSFLAKRKNSFEKKPKIAILCEYDAVEGVGHSCGHSASCAASIICALALEATYEDFPFDIDLIGTPNEEIAGAKISMLEKGLFSSYEFAILSQMSPVNSTCFHTLAASDLNVHFFGKTAHASANPWEGINALNGVQLFFHAIDLIRPYLEPGSQISGIIKDGGIMPNLIPDKASAYVYLRANRYEQILRLKERVENCAKGSAIASENQFTTEQLNPTYAEIFCGPTTEKILGNIMDQLNLSRQETSNISGSSDVGNVNLEIPVLYPMISIGKDVPLYSKEFAECMRESFGENGMKTGALVMGKAIIHLAMHPDELQAIKEEHDSYRN